MKNRFKNIKKSLVSGFTLVEMLIVLLVISVLLLLFVPNLSKQKEAVSNTGKAAVVKVVESQAELYELSNAEEASLSKLVSAGSISQEQVKAYQDYYAKNTDKTPTVAP